MSRILITASLCLLLSQMADAFVARPRSAAPAVPGYSFKQATRGDIVLRNELKSRRARTPDGKIRKRQVNPSCPAYPTCSPSFTTASNYCQVGGWDLYAFDLGSLSTQSHQACVESCEATAGCVGVVWNPRTVNVDPRRDNCHRKGNDFDVSGFQQLSTPEVAVTLLGACCDFEDRIPAAVAAAACQDDNQPFVFPTCTGDLRRFTGSAVYQSVGMDNTANADGYPAYPGLTTTNEGFRIRANNLADCSAACLSVDGCVAVVWRPDLGGDTPNCAFKTDGWPSASLEAGSGFQNVTTSPTMGLAALDQTCESQSGNVPPIVSYYCCNDPVARVYPTCPSSTGDGSAFYLGYDMFLNDLPEEVATTPVTASSAAECASLCFDSIGAACIGTTYNGQRQLCHFKSIDIPGRMTELDRTDVSTTFRGGCSRYSTLVGEAADSICCENN